MRHYKKGRKLGTDKSHTKAMKRSLVTSLFENDRIKTIEARAKEIRPDVDKIVTWAKKGDLHSRRLAIAALGNNSDLVREIFEKAEKGMWADRNGGYTRIMKLGYRKGDNAPMVIMELVTEPVAKKAKDDKPAEMKKSAKAKASKAKKAAEEKALENAEAIEAKTDAMTEAVEEKAEEAKEAIEEKAEAVEEKAEAVQEKVEAKAEAIREKTDAKAEAVEEKAEKVKEALEEKIEEAKEALD